MHFRKEIYSLEYSALTIARSAIELRGSLTYKKITVNKIEENEPEKLNRPLITDYAKVENKKQKRSQPHTSHDSSTFQAFKFN